MAIRTNLVFFLRIFHLLLVVTNDIKGISSCDDEIGCDLYKRSTHFAVKESPVIDPDQEQSDMMMSGVCREEYLADPTMQNRDRCSTGDFSSSHFDVVPNITDFKYMSCYCDSKCRRYSDCCVDATDDDKQEVALPWSCRDIRRNSMPMYVYVLQRCSSVWEGDEVRSLCEEEADSLQSAGRPFSHLQNIAVHSRLTNIIYRNVYCAVCNYESDLTKWRTDIHCNGHANHSNWKASSPEVDLSTQGTYNPRKNNWQVRANNEIKTCRLIIDEFSNWRKFAEKYGGRLCKPAIDTCPLGASQQEKDKCKSYMSYVYELKRNGKLKSVYKNFHCALCNRVPVDQISCIDPSDPIVLFTDQAGHGKAWLPLLFDFNFDGDDDNQVGVSKKCLLSEGQIWDPLLGSCLNATCGRLYRRENGKCVRIKNEDPIDGNSSMVSDCERVILTQNMFIVLSNGSIYVNHSRKVHDVGNYEVHKQNGTWLEVQVCADDQLYFQFASAQLWLSELTLSLSIICLFLHLVIYSILPKLRNRPGKILMSLSSSLLCGHFFFLLGTYSSEIYWLCHVIAVITHFGYLSAFFWMSVMAYDIYRTFSTSTTRSPNNKSTFVKYSLYAWSASFADVFVAVIVDHTALDSAFKPNYGLGVCWFNQKRSLLIFFAVPLAILLLQNIAFFIATAVNIQHISKQTKIVSKFSDKVRYFLYIKLAVVLGLTWLFGFLAALLQVDALWYPFIVLNGLQGALIFFVFTVKRKVMHMLVVKLKLRSTKYKLATDTAGKKVMYSSLSNLTTLQTSVTSSVVPALSGNEQLLKVVHRLNSESNATKL